MDSLALLRKLDFPVVEIHPMGTPGATPGRFPGFEFDRLTQQQKSAIREALTGFRHITAHLPYSGLDYFAKDDAVAAAAEKVVDTALEGSAYSGRRFAFCIPSRVRGRPSKPSGR
jgi:hypothetical protein